MQPVVMIIVVDVCSKNQSDFLRSAAFMNQSLFVHSCARHLLDFQHKMFV